MSAETVPSSPLQEVLAHATVRIQEIIEAAERVAAGIIADAEAHAQVYTSQRIREISELTESLIQYADAVKRQSDQLLHTLGDLQPGSAQPPTQLHSIQSPPPQQPPPQPEPQAPPGGEDQARLAATRMAVAGGNRAEIEERLRSEYGVRDPGPMLDAILGEERK